MSGVPLTPPMGFRTPSRGATDRGGWTAIVAAAVAHHSGALLDLAERGLPEGLLSPWPRDERLASVLTYLDAISGAMGQVVTVEARLADIVARYGEASRQVRAFRATLAEIERGRALSA